MQLRATEQLIPHVIALYSIHITFIYLIIIKSLTLPILYAIMYDHNLTNERTIYKKKFLDFPLNKHQEKKCEIEVKKKYHTRACKLRQK